MEASKESKTSYRSYDILNNHPFTSQQEEEIDFIAEIFRKLLGIQNFQSKFILIATWNVQTLSSFRVSFILVLVS